MDNLELDCAACESGDCEAHSEEAIDALIAKAEAAMSNVEEVYALGYTALGVNAMAKIFTNVVEDLLAEIGPHPYSGDEEKKEPCKECGKPYKYKAHWRIAAGGPGSGRHAEETFADVRKRILAKHKPFNADGSINTSVTKDPEFHLNGIWNVQMGNHLHKIYKDPESTNWMQETNSGLHWSKDPDAIVSFTTKQDAIHNILMKHLKKGDISAEEQPMKEQKKEWPLQRHTTFAGMQIAIENKKGSVRSGKEPDGTPWSIKMPYDYGYIKGTEGTDGDEVDVFIGPDKNAKYVYVVHQNKIGKNGEKANDYDEDKCMLGFSSAGAAKKAYHSAYNNVDLFHSMSMIPIEEFKKKCKEGKGKIHAAAKTYTLSAAAIKVVTDLISAASPEEGEQIEDTLGDGKTARDMIGGGPGSGRKPGFGLTEAEMKREAALANMRKKNQDKMAELHSKGLSKRAKPILSEKSKRAAAAVRAPYKEAQDFAEGTEAKIEDHLGKGASRFNQDSEPYDIVHKTADGKSHGLEVKSMLFGKNDKITQKKDAVDKKNKYAKAHKLASQHTVVVDYRKNKDNPDVYHAHGHGSFRIGGGSLEKVPGGFGGLKKFMSKKYKEV